VLDKELAGKCRIMLKHGIKKRYVCASLLQAFFPKL
jgi:hypothetical protein